MNTTSYDELVRAVGQSGRRPLAFVLGSGMGPVIDRIKPRVAAAFADIPGMSAPTVSGHGGTLTLGEWAGAPVLVFSGRLHYYEGWPWERVVRPMEVLAEFGAAAVVLTNASGGINRAYTAGTLMALTDHLEWNEPNFWRVARLPSPYDPRLLDALARASEQSNVELRRGVYAAVTGPNYETPAEVRALASCGADAVGMSTAREARRACELGLPVAAVSCVANLAAGLSNAPLSHREVLEAVAVSAERLGRLLEAFVRL